MMLAKTGRGLALLQRNPARTISWTIEMKEIDYVMSLVSREHT